MSDGHLFPVRARWLTECFLQALYAQAQNMSFTDLALEVLAADSMMYWGQHAMDMYTIFENRGILDIPDIGFDQEQGAQACLP